ncbi:S8 family serine peptidase [Chitinimonas arctica]|uniref:S8 family serine peptidase n=1 Tax=Chitinimonas arctica TaxID=2594795 RepID=A0A516SK95_9NEIS|nr:S8 family peptidase [Chitinimonas arctica]QDQ28579.1 S8 family serine peptidase [Chitinimonas arctica]
MPPSIRTISLGLSLFGLVLAQSATAGERRPSAAAQLRSAAIPGLIIKFRTPPMAGRVTPGEIRQQGAERVQRLAAPAARAGLTLQFSRRLATGADLFKLSRPLSSAAAFRLARSMQRQHPDIEYAEPDVINKVMGVGSAAGRPNDASFPAQWDLHEAAGGMNVPPAWLLGRGRGVVVAVLDTGVRPHADLQANLLPGYDFVSDMAASNDEDGRDDDASDPGDDCGLGNTWHGTHVAGTVAAVADNGIGISGVAPEAKVVPVRVLGMCGGRSSDIVDGMVWAAGGEVEGVPANANPARILNLSLGSAIPCLNSYREAVNRVVALGGLVVAAAGNESQNVRSDQPASCPGAFAVSAVNREGGRAYYSNYGAMVGIAAPGGELYTHEDGILSTLNDGVSELGNDSYDYYQGTSMAAPHIAGLAALMWSVNPRLSAAQIRSLIMSTARPFPAACASCGAGIADAEAAVKAAKALR